MTDNQIFTELVRQGVVSETVSEKVLGDAALAGKNPEELLYERGIADEETVARFKSVLLGVPRKKVDAAVVPDDLLAIIPKETSEHYRVIPISRDKGVFVVGMLRPDNLQAQEALKFIARRERLNLGVYLVTPSDLKAVWRRYAPFQSEIEAAMREIGLRNTEDVVSVDAVGDDVKSAPVIKIVSSILKRAVQMKASDIHIEPQRMKLRVRFRLDGDLEEATSAPSNLIQPIVSRIKVLANMKLDEARVPQDGRFRTVIENREIDFRVSTFPTPHGEKAVLRVLDSLAVAQDFRELGVSDYNLELINNAVDRPYGMVLITGPTGSGKTTTLYAVLRRLNTEKANIVSLEDPVEYVIEGVNQSQIYPEIGYTFATGLRQILRQDPDIIMVGEIRDSETADLAVNAALTGHVVLSTLHTNNSVGVIPRLIDLKSPAFLLSSTLNLMVAQRLLGKLCPSCKKATEAPSGAAGIIEKALEETPAVLKKETAHYKKPYKIWIPEPKSNCEICRGRGFSGRVALFEVFRMTRELGDIINSGFTEGSLWDEARRQGIVTLRQDGIIKALAGEVHFAEVLRETEE